ncbi:hypothetical protein THAOC_32976 [Thalassiosira oceanica]|uniref:Uncharacterized protein n=1 Tax=Thalassiosira oceanica TaxID=159749 RepID=K0R839_THAOC|nr:hypothetical protein THAOC_32976 [Thalassiosira oceanica]|eukprot:EJK48244.1 hypothetical protein THAOC_32976 [Thalassiosira oceanica]
MASKFRRIQSRACSAGQTTRTNYAEALKGYRNVVEEMEAPSARKQRDLELRTVKNACAPLIRHHPRRHDPGERQVQQLAASSGLAGTAHAENPLAHRKKLPLVYKEKLPTLYLRRDR